MGKPVTVMLGSDLDLAERRRAATKALVKGKVRVPPQGTDPVVYEAWTGHPPEVEVGSGECASGGVRSG